ncbi:hypothetical protein FRB95_010607 [Tulasnella sp. JGI-2019a]|nr:hypothetical protein FRB95_010607 [Tulasnella sp. JGI-2019a]
MPGEIRDGHPLSFEEMQVMGLIDRGNYQGLTSKNGWLLAIDRTYVGWIRQSHALAVTVGEDVATAVDARPLDLVASFGSSDATNRWVPAKLCRSSRSWIDKSMMLNCCTVTEQAHDINMHGCNKPYNVEWLKGLQDGA